MRLAALYGVVLAAAAISAPVFAAPPPQYTVQDLQKSFSKPPAEAPAAQDAAAGQDAPADAAPGSCAAQGMADGPDGVCEPMKKRSRGFSLVGAAPAARPAASASASPRAAHTARAVHHATPSVSIHPVSRDLLIAFDNNSTQLTEQAKSNAHVFAEALRGPALQGVRFEIDGNTNAVGSRERNLELSRQRAQSLVDYLVAQGVERDRFDVHGYGFDQPLPGLSPDAAGNRRVEAKRLN